MSDVDFIERKIELIIREVLCVEMITIYNYSTLADLGANSLDKVDIILEIEKEFNIDISKTYPNRIYELDFEQLCFLVQKSMKLF